MLFSELNSFNKEIQMRCVYSTSNNPHFNLATEEYFLKNSTEEIFLLYTNEPCIVVGKHQNLLSEINWQEGLQEEEQYIKTLTT